MILLHRLDHLENAIPADELTPNEYRKILKPYMSNPIVKACVSGKPGYAEEYVAGLHDGKWDKPWRFLFPHRKDEKYNKRGEVAQELLPETRYGFRTEGLLAYDNPVGTGITSGLLTFGGLKLIGYLFSFGDQEFQQFGQIFVQNALYGGLGGLGLGLFYGGRAAYDKRAARSRTKQEAQRLTKIFSLLNR